MKTLPPRGASWYVARPRLADRLDEAVERRLTLVVAGAGHGKTTQLAERARARGWAWYTIDEADAAAAVLANGIAAALHRAGALPELRLAAAAPRDADGAESLAAGIVEALDEARDCGDLVLVLDDLHELGRDTPGAVLVERLVRYAPPWVHLVVGSREQPPFAVARLRGSGGVLDLTSRDLAFGVDDVAEVLAARVGEGARPLAGRLRDATGGWPVAVYLASESLRREPEARHAELVGSLARRSDVLVDYLAEEVIGRLEGAPLAVLSDIAVLGGASADLLEGLGTPEAARVLHQLARHGLVEQPGGSADVYALHALVRAFLLAHVVDPAEARSIQARASAWHEERGELSAALRLAVFEGDPDRIVALLNHDQACALMYAGETDLVLQAFESLPESAVGRVFPYDVTHAYLIRGELDRAEALIDRAAAGGAVPCYVGVQRALIAIGRGASQAAYDALVASCPEALAFTSAFMAYQLLALGRHPEAEVCAERAMSLAREDPVDAHEAHAALGAVRLAAGRLTEAEQLFATSVELGRRNANVLAECAHLCRLSAARGRRGSTREALDLAVASLTLADRIGSSPFKAEARIWQSRWLLSLGRLDEAQRSAEAAVACSSAAGAFSTARALGQLGTVHLERGEPAQARALLEQAQSVSAASDSLALHIETTATLARAVAATDPDAAARLIARDIPEAALSFSAREAILVAEGWIAVLRDDRATALRAATELVEAATFEGNPDLLAEGYALRSFTRGRSRDGIADLEEAAAIWRRLGHPLSEARAVLALATLDGPVDGPAVERARAVLGAQAVREADAGAGLGAMIAGGDAGAVTIRTFGRFAVLRDGREVSATAWQSRKARDLLKLLVCREGGVAVRDVLVEELWPDEDPRKTRNRLSVALNVVRGVLDPDGEHPPDWYVAGDRGGLRLDLEHVDVDVLTFLDRARRAFAAVRSGDPEAPALLEAAEQAHGGAFLEEDVHAEWASGLRERVRSAYADLLRSLMRFEHSSDRFHLRLLALDPYDEDVHLDLVRLLGSLGRHGEARRAYRSYASRMREIGVEPAPVGGPDVS